MPSISGQSIPCAQCGERFFFSDAERSFYDAKALVAPRRCKACRAARKSRAEESGAGGALARRERGERRERASWAATCTGCGARASVPFEPAAGREVFCASCWRARRELPGVRAHARGGAPLPTAWSERVAPIDAADTDAEREIGMPAIIE